VEFGIFTYNRPPTLKFYDHTAGLKGMALGQKLPISRKSILSLSFCPIGTGPTFLETSGLGLEKIESQGMGGCALGCLSRIKS